MDSCLKCFFPVRTWISASAIPSEEGNGDIFNLHPCQPTWACWEKWKKKAPTVVHHGVGEVRYIIGANYGFSRWVVGWVEPQCHGKAFEPNGTQKKKKGYQHKVAVHSVRKPDPGFGCCSCRFIGSGLFVYCWSSKASSSKSSSNSFISTPGRSSPPSPSVSAMLISSACGRFLGCLYS